MKSTTSLRSISLVMALLIVSLPICFASEINIQTDANGNVVYDGEYYREYNGLNQLVRIYNGTHSSAPLLQEFEHDPVEERIIKKVTYNPDGSPKETAIYFDKDFVRVDYHNGTVLDTEYVYFNDQMVAQVEESGETYFMHGDNIGSNSVISNSDGVVVENTTYEPFGSIVSGGSQSRFNYENKEFDSVVGDTDFHFRKYKSDWNLFLQPDTLIQNVYDPQMLNRYSFERNNPYKYVDPDGHVLSVGAIIVLGTYYALQGLGVTVDVAPIYRYYKNPTERNFKSMIRNIPEIGSAIGGFFNIGVGIYSMASTIWSITAISQIGIKEYIFDEQDNQHWDLYYYETLTPSSSTNFIDNLAERLNSLTNNFFYKPEEADLSNPGSTCDLDDGSSGGSSGGWDWDTYNEENPDSDAASGWMDYYEQQTNN